MLGGGIVGLCTAIETQRRGLRTLVIDRGGPGEACSYGNAGVLASQGVVPVALPGIARQAPRMLLDPSGPLVIRRKGLRHTIPWLIAFQRASKEARVRAIAKAMKALFATTVELHEGLARDAGVADLIKRMNYLVLYRDQKAGDVNALPWQLRREHGAIVEVFDGAGAIRELEPDVAPLYTRAIRYGPMACTINPLRLSQAYARLFIERGGRIKQGDVQRIVPAREADGGRAQIHLRDSTVEADHVVVALGAWSRALVEPLGLRLPLIAERGYHAMFADPGVTLSHVLHEASRHCAITPMEEGLRIGGTDELGDPDDSPRWRRADVLAETARAMFPRADLSRMKRWMGPRPGTPDSLPYIGPLPDHPDVHLACGHSHWGLTGAPQTGRIVAGLIAGERFNIDLTPYAPTRFAG